MDITYDYIVIERCIDMMQKKAAEIIDQTDDLEKEVKEIMVGWAGSTAEAYSALCADLESDLRQNADNLNTLKSTVHSAAERMREQDQQGGSRVNS